MKKTTKLALGALVSLLVLSGVAYALSSDTFKTKADTWVTNNCNPAITNQQNATCYSVLKAEELDASLTVLTTTVSGHTTSINNLQTQVDGIKQLWMEDAGGQKLGLSNINGDANFWNTSLARYMSYGSTGYLGHNATVFFASTDCTGSAYMGGNTDEINKRLLVAGTQYFTYTNSALTASFDYNSILGPTGTCTASSNTASSVYLLNSVSLPFTVPITLPTVIKYEQ